MADPSLGCLSTGAWGGEELRKEENRRRQSPGSPERRGWSAVPCLSRGDDQELSATSRLTVEEWTRGPGSERSLDGFWGEWFQAA